jgi:hypothetical protein
MMVAAPAKLCNRLLYGFTVRFFTMSMVISASNTLKFDLSNFDLSSAPG